jgi:hypothetical protein
MFVFDTSAYINGQRDHLPIVTFPTVWQHVADAIDAGTVILPREVYRELTAIDDDLAKWIKQRTGAVVEPTQQVQREAGLILQAFPNIGVRNAADPFIVAEAKIRSLTVTTYEGRTFSGVPHARWHRSMPGVCQHFHVPCCTLPEALAGLGLMV